MNTTCRLPGRIETDRYMLRRAAPADAGAIHASYATDAAVTRHLGWRPHAHPGETAAFLERAAQEWDAGTGFPVVVFARLTPDRLVGMFHPQVPGATVSYGYVLCADAWGKGRAKSCAGSSRMR